MFNINFKFDIDQVVYYIKTGSSISENSRVEQGKIRGFVISKSGNDIKIGVNLKQENNYPIDFISDNKEEIQKMVDAYNAKTIDERLYG